MKAFTYRDYLRYQESNILNKLAEQAEEYHYFTKEINKKHDKLIKKY